MTIEEYEDMQRTRTFGRTTQTELKDASEIKGHYAAKRAILVAAAGQHSILFVGPPGGGKTMLRELAKSLGVEKAVEMWPCPCGYLGTAHRACYCNEEEIRKFRLWWPQCDIFCEVPAVSARELLSTAKDVTTETYKEQVRNAAKWACPLSEDAELMLKQAASERPMSAQQVVAAIRVAQTISRLEQARAIGISAICEAINFAMPI